MKEDNEIYLKRKVDDVLLEWHKNPDRYPLIIGGARQIGKTKSIKHFAKAVGYESVVEINFATETIYKGITVDGYGVDSIIKNISVIDTTKKFIDGKTLIFFDEITNFPEIATSLKPFKLDGRFDVICSGSLLGINYKEIESNSVGHKEDYQMFSMDFEEYLWARGYLTAADDIFDHMMNLKPFNDLEMKIYRDLFIEYVILGGMPSVVASYITKKTFQDTLRDQRQLIKDYKEDIRKYTKGLEQTRLMNVFGSIPSQLAKENKKFQLSKVSHGARFVDYAGCAEWLSDSGIVNICRCLNFPELPLSGNYDFDKFKLYFADTGLLVSQLDDESQNDLRANKNLGVFKGALYENAIGEALAKQKYALSYYKRNDALLEEDFFIRNANCLIPIEVKATNGNAKSLRTLIDSDKYQDIKFGIKLANDNIGHVNRVYTFPHFCAFLLRKFVKNFKFKEEE